MTKSEQKLEKVLKRAYELFAPVCKYAEEDHDQGGPRTWWTMTQVKKYCHFRLKGHKNWKHLRDMLEARTNFIYLPTGSADCYTFSTGPEDNLKSILASFDVEVGVQTRSSYLTLWRTDPNKEHALGAEQLKRLAARYEEAGTRVQNRLRYLAARITESELLEAGEPTDQGE